jgi:hypothetical protein
MGGKDVEVNLDNIKFDITSDSSIDADIDSDTKTDIKSESNIDIDLDGSNLKTELVLPQPFRTESKFAITEPIVMENRSDIGLDVRPLVMDFCFKFEFGEFPSTCIRQPYQHHFGITLFGIEVLGFNLAGESRILIEDVVKKPQVVWGGEGHSEGRPSRKRATRQAESDSGLSIRLGS